MSALTIGLLRRVVLVPFSLLCLTAVLAWAVPISAGDIREEFIGKPAQEPRESDLPAIPRAWGRLVNVVPVGRMTWFYFEAGDGTIRRVAATSLWSGDLPENAKWVRK